MEEMKNTSTETTEVTKTSKLKDPYFWTGLIGIVLVAAGIEPASLTSWSIVQENLMNFITNPVAIAGVVLAVIGVFKKKE